MCTFMDAHVTMCDGCLAVERHQINLILSIREHLMAKVHLPLD